MKFRLVLTLLVILGFSLQGIPFVQSGSSSSSVRKTFDGLIGAAAAAAVVPQSVIWANLVNCAFDGSSLKKTAGSSTAADAGANSTQAISAGDGFVEFTATETGKDRYLGLTNDYLGTWDPTIDFALHLTRISLRTGYVVEVIENGKYKTETTYTSKTLFRIAVEGGAVKYYKNGAVFYTSAAKPVYPLVVDASLRSLSSTITNAVIVTAPSTLPPSPADTIPPVISAVTGSASAYNRGVINWATNEPATSQVDYGPTTAYGSTVTLNTLDLIHRVDLIGLAANSVCHFRVRSRDAANNQTTSGGFVFSTPAAPADTTPPVISGVNCNSITSSTATINWVTNETASSVVEYGPTTAYGNTTTIGTLDTNHRINLIGLQPSITYHYRVKSTDAAGNLAVSGDLTFSTSAIIAGGGSPGMLDDRLAHVPANYTSFTPPAVGGSYTDPMYGTRITRLSNGPSQFGQAVHHEYATMSPFNKDNTRILLLTENSGFYIADLQGNVILPTDRVRMGGMSEPRWSTTDPNTIYFHDWGTNQIKKFDITTGQKTVVRTFTQYSTIDFGGGESDISDDGNHMVIIGDGRYVGVYTFSTDTLGATLDIGGRGFDYFDMTANNNVIVRWTLQGAGRYSGFEVFDGNMNFLRQAYPYGAHADRGRDLNGDEVLVVLAATDLAPAPGCEGNGIEKVRLSDGRKTCLMALNWDVGAHISANSNGTNPWVLVEATDERNGTQNSNTALPSDWQSRWKPYYNELILIKIDGSEVRRIAHHRSRNLDSYWFTPRAALSRDGSYAIFDSNFASYPVSSYTDAYLINLKGN